MVVKIPPGNYLEVPAYLLHGGSEKLQPDRVYVLLSKEALTKEQKLAVKLSAEFVNYHEPEDC